MADGNRYVEIAGPSDSIIGVSAPISRLRNARIT